jgi:hypothetical protein
MAYIENSSDDDQTLKLRIVYEATQVVNDAIAQLRKLKEETGALTEEQEKGLRTLEVQKTLLDGAGSSLDHYTELVHDEVQAQKLMRQALEETTQEIQRQADAEQALSDVVASNQKILEASTISFDKLGGQVFKAERAVQALASGTGLGRLGPMLESVTMAIGGPAGLGMALGAAAFALEGMLPKLEAWIDKWEKGEKTVDAVKEAMAAIDRSQEMGEREHALRRVQRQITKLEEKEDLPGGKLSEFEQEQLNELRARAFNTAQLIKEEKQVAGLGGSSKAIRARGGAVKEAFAEAGISGADVAKNIAEREGISIDDAYRIVAGAAGGSAGDIAMVQRHSERFAAAYGPISPEAKEAEKKAKATQKEAHKAEQQAKHEETQRVAYNREIEHMDAESDRKAKQERTHLAQQKYAEQQRIEREQRAAEAKAAREAEHRRKQDTPTARFHAQQKAEEEQALGAVQQYAPGLAPGLQAAAAKHARENHQAGLDMSATFSQALDYAIMQARQDFARGIQAGMRRQQSYGEMRGQ